jgi:hypothetical protein
MACDSVPINLSANETLSTRCVIIIGVYFEAYFFALSVVLFLCFIVDLIFSPVIHLFQDFRGWKPGKIVRDLPQAQKKIPII